MREMTAKTKSDEWAFWIVVLGAFAAIGLWAPLPPPAPGQGGVTERAEYFRVSRRPKEGLLPVWLLEDAIAAKLARR
jgi:hypothetical protein